MAGRGAAAPVHSRARPCRKCGTDGWRQSGKTWRCVQCDREGAKSRMRRQRKARPEYVLLEGAKARAAKSGIACTITEQDIRDVWPRDGLCPALGLRLRGGKVSGPASPSLDRLNPEWGYERGNIAVISFLANRIKSTGTAKDLEAIAAWMRRRGLD